MLLPLLPQLHKFGLRQYGLAASASLRASRSSGKTGAAAVAAALRRPQGLAGSSLARQAGRRLKATITEFRAMPNAAEASRSVLVAAEQRSAGWLCHAGLVWRPQLSRPAPCLPARPRPAGLRARRPHRGPQPRPATPAGGVAGRLQRLGVCAGGGGRHHAPHPLRPVHDLLEVHGGEAAQHRGGGVEAASSRGGWQGCSGGEPAAVWCRTCSSYPSLPALRPLCLLLPTATHPPACVPACTPTWPAPAGGVGGGVWAVPCHARVPAHQPGHDRG